VRSKWCQRATQASILILVEANFCLHSTIMSLDYLQTSAHRFVVYGALYSGLLHFEHTFRALWGSCWLAVSPYGEKEGYPCQWCLKGPMHWKVRVGCKMHCWRRKLSHKRVVVQDRPDWFHFVQLGLIRAWDPTIVTTGAISNQFFVIFHSDL
jgi:hypothetical protein